MNNNLSAVTVTVVTVVFLRGAILCILYITIYISISYKVLQGISYPLFLTVTTVTVTSSLFSLFPYKASKCPEQFVGHIGGIVLHAFLSDVPLGVRDVSPDIFVIQKSRSKTEVCSC